MKSDQARRGDSKLRSSGPGGDSPAHPGATSDPAPASAEAPPVPRSWEDRGVAERILQTISDGIVATDASGRVVFANPAAAALWGASSPGDLCGRSIAELAAQLEILAEDGQLLTADDLPAAQAIAGRASERLLRWRRAGSPAEARWALVRATPAFGPRGEVEAAISVIRDVSEREHERERQRDDNARLYAKAQEALGSRDDLLGIVSHDLRNPLGVVLTSSALLLRGTLPPDKGDQARRRVEAIQRAGNRMNALIRDLLDFASIDSGRLVLARRAQDVGVLLSDVLDFLRPLAVAKSQQLVGEGPTQPLNVDGDHDRLLQIFSSIVGNSFKFCPEGARIRIAARAEGSGVRFTVADDGPGMAPDEIENMFDRAWQARRTNRDGIGLGLSIVKGIVEAHGGRVWAESALGEGTRMHFTIPAAPPTG